MNGWVDNTNLHGGIIVDTSCADHNMDVDCGVVRRNWCGVAWLVLCGVVWCGWCGVEWLVV